MDCTITWKEIAMQFLSTHVLRLSSVACISLAAALSGCSAKKPTSEVVVAPMGVTGASGSAYYDGGALVNNNTAIVNAANSMGDVVYFAFDSSDIDAQGQSVLSQHAQFLQANPSARVVIAGHTDERGSREYNMALGERRARAAQSYLTGQGISADRTEAVSYGEDQPADPGHNEAAWAKNRRAVLSY